MKRKLLSIVSVVLAMSMTTSAFAATARGTGEVDGSEGLTANDVFMIMKGLADENPEANVDGRTGIDGLDAKVLYNTILQPKTVSEDLTLKAYSEGMVNDVEFGVFNAEELGSTGRDVQANGLDKVVPSVDTNATTATTIKDAIDQLVGKAATLKLSGINNQLNNIYFISQVKGNVYLSSENGWSMLCNALRYIVPMDIKTAQLCNGDGYADYTYYDPATASEEDTARYNALMNVKEKIVGSREITSDVIGEDGTINNDAAKAQHNINLSADDIDYIMENLYTAIPSGLEADVIRLTAAEVLSITGTRYHFTVNSEDMGIDEVLDKETDVNSSAFINGLVELSDYANKTMADYRNTFGDKLTVGTPNVKVTFEVAVVAGVDEDSSEATTADVTEATTETTTAATTETTTEAPTETTTEAAPSGEGSGSVAGMPMVSAPTDSGNLQIPLGTTLKGSEVVLKTVLNFDVAAKGGALLTVSYDNNGTTSDSKAKLRMDTSGNIAIDSARDVALGTLAAGVDNTIEFIINTNDGTFKVAVNGGTPVESDLYVDANLTKGVAGVKISQGNGTDAQRTTTVKEVSWTGNEASSDVPADTTTEATTEAPTEATTEAPTEATTEAPTEATTEAPSGEGSGSVAGMPMVSAPTDSGNLQIPLGTTLNGNEVVLKTVLNFDVAAKGGALLTVSYDNNGTTSDSKAKLRMDTSGNIAIDSARDISLGTLTAGEDHTIEFIINTVDGTFKVAVDGGAPVESDLFVDANLIKGVAGVKISQGNGTDAQRTTTVKEVSWTGNEN